MRYRSTDVIVVIKAILKRINTVREKREIVYVGMAADILHPGHLNVIREAQKLGDVVIGLLTDEAIASYKRVPFMKFKDRLEVIKNINGVNKVIPQETLDYRPNLSTLKPKYVVHGTDWKQSTSTQQSTRKAVIEEIAKWGGVLVETAYTEGISSSAIRKKVDKVGISPSERLEKLQYMLDTKRTAVRVMEAHNGLSALVVENIKTKNTHNKNNEFDAIWVSSLTDSTAKGKPDIELVDRTSRIATINEILDVTTKPLIVDGDTGGYVEHFVYSVRTLERLGVSAIVIEDKKGLKQNSFVTKNVHSQEDMEVFAAKIKAGIDARVNEKFLVIARIESLVLGKGHQDAVERAKCYLNAGASAIMIHSKNKNGADIKKFTQAYKKLENKKPLMCVPTMYNKIYEQELTKWGANIIVYANQLLRASLPAMEHVAQTILTNQRSYEAESEIVPIDQFLKIVKH